MRILIVAEKPSQAREVSQALSHGSCRRRPGKSKTCPNFDFRYKFRNQDCEVTVTSVAGHLMNIDFGPEYKSWKAVDPVLLFEAPIVKGVHPNYVDIQRNLKQETVRTDVLIIWTDYDREGENIGAEIVAVCREVRATRMEVLRAKFSVFTPEGIHNAMRNPVPLDYAQVAAVDARMELDLRVGSSLTRFQTLRLAPRFKEVNNKIISYGPCQFPTLGFVVDQYLKVERFIPEPFWQIDVTHTKPAAELDDDGKGESGHPAVPVKEGMTNQRAHAKFTWTRTRLFDRWSCALLYEQCVNHPIAEVTRVDSKPTSKWKPVPLTTVEMLMMASKYLKISSDAAMKAAESLYNKGFLSYPRTETDQFASDFAFEPLLEKQTGDPTWGRYAQRLLDGERRPPRNGRNNDKAHPPIHPTAYAANLAGPEKKLYEMIVRRFLAVCWDDAKGHKTEVTIRISGEEFRTKGLMVLARNYLLVYPYERWSESTIPCYQRGERFTPTEIKMNGGTTSTPQLLTEHELMKRMEMHGIGTDATIPQHIKTIQDREYAIRQANDRFCPSTLGVALVEGYDTIGFDLSLSKPYLRSVMERDMKRIIKGERTKEQVIAQTVSIYREVYTKTLNQFETLEMALIKNFGHAPDAEAPALQTLTKSVGQCQSCGKATGLRTTAAGKIYIGCAGYPLCRDSIWFPDFVTAVDVLEETCQRCVGSPRLLELSYRPGSFPIGYPSPYRGCLGGCDETLTELFNVRRPSGTATSTVGPQSRVSTATAGQPLRRYPSGQLLRPTTPSADFNGSLSRNESSSSFGNPGTAYSTLTVPANGGGGGINQPDPSVQCLCGTPAVMRVTRKDGPNKDRTFYICANPRESQCDFFQWSDAAEFSSAMGAAAAANTNATHHRNSTALLPSTQVLNGFHQHLQASSTSDSARIQCRCNLLAVSAVAQSAGPNQGRTYFKCSKSYQACQFFQWGDEPSGSNSVGFGGGGGGNEDDYEHKYDSMGRYAGSARKSTCSTAGKS
ncbi:DNA topoisomerase 3-alpha, partial [Tieghemiomyces parasiticus]